VVYICDALQAAHSPPQESIVILDFAEGQSLLATHLPILLDLHRTGYKRRDEFRAAAPSRWADQDAATKGRIVHNLILARAAEEEGPGRRMAKDGGARVMEVTSPLGDVTALLRFRRIEFLTRYIADGPVPTITTPLTPQAKAWFGNDHIAAAANYSLLDEVEPSRPATNLLVGHTADPDTGELGRVVVACYLVLALRWWFDGEAGGESGGSVVPFPDAPTEPTTPRTLRVTARFQGAEEEETK
jgi:hypothetical protein